MCGRSRVALSPDTITAIAGTTIWIDRDRYVPTENVSPGRWTPVIRPALRPSERGAKDEGQHGDAVDNQPATAQPEEIVSVSEGPETSGRADVAIQSMRWGLVPSFTKATGHPDPWRMFNARSETASQLASFRRLVPYRRCIILVNGFYEWKKEGLEGKVPYYIHLSDNSPMALAGLYDCWEGPEGPMYTYTILTCPSSEKLEWLHDRMPVILGDEHSQEMWLHNPDGFKADALLRQVAIPYNGENLQWYSVTKAMSNPSFQGPECSQAMKKATLKSFFGKNKTCNLIYPGKTTDAVYDKVNQPNRTISEHRIEEVGNVKKDTTRDPDVRETKEHVGKVPMLSPAPFYGKEKTSLRRAIKSEDSNEDGVEETKAIHGLPGLRQHVTSPSSGRKRQKGMAGERTSPAIESPASKKNKSMIQKDIGSFFVKRE